MFIPNTDALLLRRNGRDAFARNTFAAPVPIRCSAVDLIEAVVQSPMRADMSASRGAADIDQLVAKILVPKNVTVRKGDVIQIVGKSVEIIGVTPRLNVLGEIDHYECAGNLKGNL